MKQLAAMVQPEWIKVAKLSLTNKKSKKEYYKFLELLGEVIVNSEIPNGFEETSALKLFESLDILGKLKADWERYEKKCRGKNSQSNNKKTENQETNSGKDKDNHKDKDKVNHKSTIQETYNISASSDDDDLPF